MTEGTVYPSIKPNGIPIPPGGAAAPAPASAATTTGKPHLYNPSRLPYRPQPHTRRYTRRRCSCCCCLIWSTITFLIIILVLSIVACALYVLYKPHKPTFTISSFHTSSLNVTSTSDASSSHLTSLFNITLTTKNPNNHMQFYYERFNVVVKASDIELGNGTLNGMVMHENNATSLRVLLASVNKGIDAESATKLKEEMKKRKNGLSVRVVMDTKVKVKIGKVKSKRVGIRVVCDGVKGVVVPKSRKNPSVGNVKDVNCKVDLRIKIWKFTF